MCFTAVEDICNMEYVKVKINNSKCMCARVNIFLNMFFLELLLNRMFEKKYDENNKKVKNTSFTYFT